MAQLKTLGADEVLEKHETALEIFTRVLRLFWVPRKKVPYLVSCARKAT
jgi:hypothetical protein